MKHYTKEELESYRRGTMSTLGKINCSIHLRDCPQCSEILAELDEDDKLIQDIRSSIQIFQDLSAGLANAKTETY